MSTEFQLSTLRQHPLNEYLYGTHIDEEFVASIKAFGVQEPIEVCKSNNPNLDGMVVKGRRRCMAAAAAGLKTVPGNEWECDDEDTFRTRLVLSNVRNVVTTEQKVLMYHELKEIELRSASKRRTAGKPVSEGERVGRASDLAAEAVGVSRSTAERGEKVLEVAAALKESGHGQEAKELIDVLNTQGAKPAVRKAEELGAKTHTSPSPIASPQIKSLDGKELGRALQQKIAALKNSLKSSELAMGAVVRQNDACRKSDSNFAGTHAMVEKYLRMVDKAIADAQAAVQVLHEKLTAKRKVAKNVETEGSDNGAVAEQSAVGEVAE